MNHSITIEQIVNAPTERVFDAFITPEDLMRWHFATDGWKTPHAVTDAKPGGAFTIGYQDPAGEHTFDLTGIYTTMDRPSKLAYTLDDGRKVIVNFVEISDTQTKVIQTFEAETVNSEEMQRSGWQAQLTHLAALFNNKNPKAEQSS